MKLLIAYTIALLIAGVSSAHSRDLYDRNGNSRGSTVTNADGSVSGPNGERTVGRGNKYWSYNSNGQMTRYGIQRGGVLRHYSRDGRYLGHTTVNGSISAHYDARGRLLGTGRP
jgi:YD repeat-containing protein